MGGGRAADGAAIDRGIALFFEAPHSYTGEDVVELQLHGGPVLLQMIVARCLAVANDGADDGADDDVRMRLARPGEFTERAFLADRIDLAQAEAVADLIEASSEAAVLGAQASLSGAFSTAVGALVDAVIALRALVEATLDFPDEEIDFLEASAAGGRRAAPRAPPPPGAPPHGADGRRDDDHDDPHAVERLGIARTWEAVERAHVVLHLVDATTAAGGHGDVHADDAAIARRVPAHAAHRVVVNKIDLVGDAPHVDASTEPARLHLSARTGAGIDLLRHELLGIAGWQPERSGDFVARERHLEALRLAAQHLARARAHADRGDRALDLFAEELRLAQRALDEITGAYTADDLLGAIFGRFCIGK